jgi:hypothetical protein
MPMVKKIMVANVIFPYAPLCVTGIRYLLTHSKNNEHCLQYISKRMSLDINKMRLEEEQNQTVHYLCSPRRSKFTVLIFVKHR